MNPKGTLTFFCEKMGAGKTTKSKTVSLEKNAVLLSEDDWLEAHYPNQINSFQKSGDSIPIYLYSKFDILMTIPPRL